MFAVADRLVVPIGLAATAVTAFCDYVTGAELAFTLVYLIPIAWCTWRSGLAAGVVVAVAASGSSFAIALLQHAHDFTITVWNEASVLLIFLVMAHLTARQRDYVLRERREKQRIVDQLRHADRLNVIGTLAAGVAHEIGTPLSVISGSAELLPGAKAAEVVEMSRVIRDQTARITSIIRHLLDFGRRGGTQTSAVDLNELARKSMMLLAPIAKKRGGTLRVTEAPEPVTVRGNPSELEQVLSNLILNALHAMPTGGTVTIAIDAGGAVVVEDTGVGIAPTDLPRIFDPFFTTKDIGEGTGLGLAVSYGIVQDHGGAIAVDSELGRGSRFTVRLPLTRPGT